MNNITNREERIEVLRDKFKYTGPVEFNEKNQLIIPGLFNCSNNKLTSLEGAPDIVKSDFYCSNNELTSLKWAPHEVGGHFCCTYNQLTSLAYSPKIVGKGVSYYNNKLTSLHGIPKKIDGVFNISVFPNTPLLKILDVIGITKFTFYKKTTHDHVQKLEDLFNKHYGTKNAIMNVGLEMIQLGYGSNARL